MAGDLSGALEEAHAISKATRCQQFLFSLSLNPPKDQDAGFEAIMDAADAAEERLGLTGQPRAVVIHEKQGRRHAHVVWSRIDGNEMKAINLPHFKNRLRDLSKELYLEHGWELPDGHRENGWKNPLNFTLAEWQQAKRLDLDPREIKQMFQQAWERSDDQKSLKHALQEHGFHLARGDRRGFVAVDIHGEVFSLSRWAGVKTRAVRERLGEPDQLPSVDQTRETIRNT
ncbi:MAG: relaxase/mobilization nuclease domain-containing protein, partial [Hyphomicrobiaceae bacterium]